MKHRHKLAQQHRHKLASPNRRSEADEVSDEEGQPRSSKAKKRVRHEMTAEGKRPRVRLDKFRRGGRPRSKKFDAGGAAPPGGGISNTPTLQDFITTPRPNPIVASVQRAIPPLDRNISLNPHFAPRPNFAMKIGPPGSQGNKAGGRIGQRAKRFDDGGGVSGSGRNPDDPGGELASANESRKSTADWIKDEIMGGTRPAYKHGGRQRPRHYDDGGTIADASPIAAPNLAFGNGPPPPPRTSDDGSAISAAPPRANNPGFLNSLNAAQKRNAMAGRVKKLEGKGR